jgi:hypothetical protein
MICVFPAFDNYGSLMSALYMAVLGVIPNPPEIESFSISSIFDLALGYLFSIYFIKYSVAV